MRHGKDIMNQPLRWICDNCPGECIEGIRQNEIPDDSNCPKGRKPIWHPVRWITCSEPDRNYDRWLDEFGTRQEKERWVQEQISRGTKPLSHNPLKCDDGGK